MQVGSSKRVSQVKEILVVEPKQVEVGREI